MDQQPSRPTWSRQIEFTLAGIGCAVGLGNVWRFPYLCYRSGGGAFLVPYLLMLVVLGIPLLYMELTVGQYTRRGPVHALATVCPLLKGVGMASVAISFIMCTYYNIVITWALYYLFNSFQAPLPWQNCNNTWNTANCTDHATNSSYSSTASQEFFKFKMLGQTSGVEETGTLRWELFLILILAWILIYLCIFKGVKSTGKVVYFTALFPYVILLIALLINNGPGLVYVVYPQAFANMPVSPLWAFLFFFMLLCLGLDSVKRLSSNMEEMTGSKPNIFFRLCWLIVDPVLITVILIFSIIQFKPARYEGYVFPPWAQGVGWVIALASIIWIPLGAIHTLWVLPGSVMKKLKLSITPYALNGAKGLYNERGGGAGEPTISVHQLQHQPTRKISD
ncbi:LOW QUALITY PROTEIN: sodium-dependent dopamine transporter [Anableps anableps]